MSEATTIPIPRLDLLAALYEAQEQIEAHRRIACEPGCAACCTDQVFLTNLEAAYLRAELERLGRWDKLTWAGDLAPGAPVPAYTYNQLARCCLEQCEPPSENQAQAPGTCFLLEDGRCVAYGARPLACRVMVSRTRCAPGGQAEGDPWWFTLDTALMQISEHLALGGVYGHLAALLAGQEEGLPGCEPLPGLVAPPEHQERLQQELGPVFGRSVEGRPLGLWMDQLRSESLTG